MDNNGFNSNGQPSQYGQPQYDQPQYGQPQYGQPYDTVMVGGTRMSKPRRRLTWLWILIGVIVIIGAGAIVLWQADVFGGLRQGNEGVWAAYDFGIGMMVKQEQITGNNAKELSTRLMNEPFEIEADMELESDMLGDVIGFPIDSVNLDVQAKYDMNDLGVKMSFMGLFQMDAYLIEDEFVMSVLDQTGSTKIDLPIETDLSESMSLEQRVKAFLPFIPEDEQMTIELLQLLAVSVPDEYTVTSDEYVYSPKEDDEVAVRAITTTLDKDAMKVVATNFLVGLGSNEALKNEVQESIDVFTSFFGLEDVDLDELIAHPDLSAIDEMEAEEFSWSVYQHDGEYIGIGVVITSEETTEYQYMVEYEGSNIYNGTEMYVDGEMTQRTVGHTEWDDDTATSESDVTAIVYNNGVASETKISYDGTVQFVKRNSDEYLIDLEGVFLVEMDEQESNLLASDLGDDIALEISAEVECLLGEGLSALEEDGDWNEIYDMEWDDLDTLTNSSMSIFGL